MRFRRVRERVGRPGLVRVASGVNRAVIPRMFERHGSVGDSQAVVVGAGVVGLTAALELAKRGVEVEILEERFGLSAQSRWLTLEPVMLETVADVRAHPDLIDQGQRVESVAIYERGQLRTRADLTGLSERFPFVLVVPRQILAEFLIEQLDELGIPVHWGRRVQEVERLHNGRLRLMVQELDQVGAGISVEHPESVVRRSAPITTGVVVGADGPRSMVRQALDIEYRPVGDVRTEVTVELAGPLAVEPEVRVDVTDGRQELVSPLGGGRFRFVQEVDTREALGAVAFEEFYDDAVRCGPVTGEYLERVLARSPLVRELGLCRPLGAEATEFQEHRAARFVDGNVLLAGRAAHLLRPSLGIGEGLGLLEAAAVAAHPATPQRGDKAGAGDAYAELCERLVSKAAERAPLGPGVFGSAGARDVVAQAWFRPQA